MKNLTIKKRIILWFALVLLLIIIISEAISFVFANRVLNQNIQERLVGQVHRNAEEIEFYTNLDNVEEDENDHHIRYEKGWLEVDDDFSPYLDGISTALLDSDGSLLYGRNLVDYPEDRGFINTKATPISLSGEQYYVYDYPLDLPGDLWLRGYISTSESSNIMYHFVRISLWFTPFLALLALLGGYLITSQSLKPIAELAASAEEIGHSGDLSRRLDIGAGSDELHQLADAFNDMFEKLEKNLEAEKQFTSDVSHELRTPTAVIMAQSEYALEMADSEEEYIESFEVIQRQSMLMNNMINQLLFTSRLELGTQAVELELHDISELTERICIEQKMLGYNGITIETDIDKGVHKEIDVSLFARMLNNLIENAYKYGCHGGHIRVALNRIPASMSGDAVPEQGYTHILSVSDDGIGIAEEHLDLIWNRFFQIESSRVEDEANSKGIGLGLSMVKQISTILGFQITVESTAGQGTTFHIFM